MRHRAPRTSQSGDPPLRPFPNWALEADKALTWHDPAVSGRNSRWQAQIQAPAEVAFR